MTKSGGDGRRSSGRMRSGDGEVDGGRLSRERKGLPLWRARLDGGPLQVKRKMKDLVKLGLVTNRVRENQKKGLNGKAAPAPNKLKGLEDNDATDCARSTFTESVVSEQSGYGAEKEMRGIDQVQRPTSINSSVVTDDDHEHQPIFAGATVGSIPLESFTTEGSDLSESYPLVGKQ